MASITTFSQVGAPFHLQDTLQHIKPHAKSGLGRNFNELLRVVKGLQTADAFDVALPADWHPGEPVIVPPAETSGAANERAENIEDSIECLDWYFCTKEVSEEEIEKAIRVS